MPPPYLFERLPEMVVPVIVTSSTCPKTMPPPAPSYS